MEFLIKALDNLWHGCGGHCHTHGDDGASACPLWESAGMKRPMLDPIARRFRSGPALVLAAIMVFIVPLVLGIIGARVADRLFAEAGSDASLWQVGGLVVGFLAGVGLIRLILLFVPPKHDHSGGGEE